MGFLVRLRCGRGGLRVACLRVAVHSFLCICSRFYGALLRNKVLHTQSLTISPKQ
jgi:hypothetical protein